MFQTPYFGSVKGRGSLARRALALCLLMPLAIWACAPADHSHEAASAPPMPPDVASPVNTIKNLALEIYWLDWAKWESTRVTLKEALLCLEGAAGGQSSGGEAALPSGGQGSDALIYSGIRWFANSLEILALEAHSKPDADSAEIEDCLKTAEQELKDVLGLLNDDDCPWPTGGGPCKPNY